MNEPPFSTRPTRAVQARVARQHIIIQRPQKITIHGNIHSLTLRIPRQRNAKQRRPITARVRLEVSRLNLKHNRPRAQRRAGIVPIRRRVGLAHRKRQIRRAERRDVERVRQAAVHEARGVLVEVADLEDGRAAGGERPRQVAQRDRLAGFDGDGREGDVGVDVGEGAAVGPGVEAVVAGPDVWEGEGAVGGGLGGVVVVSALDERADGRVGIAEEDGGSGCGTAVA